MTESEMLHWEQRDFAHRYLEEADIRIPDRRRMLALVRSFYVHFLAPRKWNSVLDLGCGDGVLTHELLGVDDSISATLVDGSEDMLQKARERLAGFDRIQYIRATFRDLLDLETELPVFDFVISSLAIHHLAAREKRRLFELVFDHLPAGGHFLDFDVVLPSSDALEGWYVELWREWITEQESALRLESNADRIIGNQLEKEHHSRLDTLADQLDMLKETGFKDVDCYYKHGIFAMFGGTK
jgi:tRNA (cmo5U34)-methyltransferase